MSQDSELRRLVRVHGGKAAVVDRLEGGIAVLEVRHPDGTVEMVDCPRPLLPLDVAEGDQLTILVILSDSVKLDGAGGMS